MNRLEISEKTGFDFGDKFESEQEVRDYFQRDRLKECHPLDDDDYPTQDELNEMAAAVIDNRWHCAF